MKLTYDLQLRLNAIVRDLVETGGETFDRDAAKELRDSLPAVRLPTWTFRAVLPKLFGGGSAEGLTNTGHQVSSDDGEKTTVYTTERPSMWVGKYSIARDADHVRITDRFNDTRPDQQYDREWHLQFDGDEPVCLRAASPRTYSFSIVSFTVTRFPIWKKPAA